ncbi:MAG: transglycosylase SLT domain-containing protein [Bacteroidales bacterium]|jgi:membrane-bound lytic murein transglycosylase D|nr:transglycosylase SLT domain-containing protein [Bacteroidales bacterium]
MYKILFLSIIIFTQFTISNAYSNGTAKDTLSINANVSADFETNLDSLIQLWYVKNSIKTDYNSLYNDSILGIPEFADSIYIERLQNIPSIIDLSYNKIVRNYIHVYTKQRRENVGAMIGVSDYYFPKFEEIFESYGIPTELIYMAVIESALNPRAVSRVGATGMWQFMYGTARMYDLTINSYVDERRDPIKSAHAAALFMKDLYSMFNDWTLVIAAYNCGPGNVNKAIRRSGGKRDFWEIYYRLPRETRGYVPAYIAATYTFNYYKEHGIIPKFPEISIATDTVIIVDNLHLKQVSEVLNIPLKALRDLNPQYKLDIIPGKGSQYPITLPINFTGEFIDLQDSIFAYKASAFFNSDNTIKNPQKSYYVPQAPTNRDKLIYTVKSGDNLGYISEWYHVRISDIRYWNNVRGNTIRVGQKLNIYAPKGSAGKYASINKLSFEEKQRRIGKTVAQSMEVKPESTNNNYEYYKVRSGDTLWDIAKKYSGVNETDIMELNNISSGRSLKAGQIIKIKTKG